jgi:hypothetical protein
VDRSRARCRGCGRPLWPWDCGWRWTSARSWWISSPAGRRTPSDQGLLDCFTLCPGEVGGYRANFRFTGCACNPRWYYEQWTAHIDHIGSLSRAVHPRQADPTSPSRWIPQRGRSVRRTPHPADQPGGLDPLVGVRMGRRGAGPNGPTPISSTSTKSTREPLRGLARAGALHDRGASRVRVAALISVTTENGERHE